jgi:spermidine synthase
MSLDPARIAHQSETALDFEQRILEGLQVELGFEAAFLSMLGREEAPTVVGFDREMVEQAVRGAPTYAAELLPVKCAALARRGVAVDTEVLGAARVRNARYFREVAARIGGRHSLFAYLSWRGRPTGMLMLGRTGGAFSPSEVERIEALLPSLGVARAALGLPASRTPLSAPAAARGLRKWFGAPAEPLASLETPSGRITVRDRAGFREMLAERGGAELVWSRAALHDPAESGWPYLELFHVAAALAFERERALFVGCGGGVAVRKFARVYPGIRSDVVESEAGVIELAREFFALDTIPNVTLHVADGAAFVERAPAQSWDISVIDAYDASDMAAAFAERRFFAAIARTLRPGGALAMNVIDSLQGEGPLARVVHAARSELEDVRILPVAELGERRFGEARRNVVVAGVKPRRAR